MAAAGMEVPSSGAAPAGASKPRASASNNTKRKQQGSKVRCLCVAACVTACSAVYIIASKKCDATSEHKLL
jgi:hypothetical protein